MIEKTESITAKICAFARAWHSNKAKDKIFDDYLAYDLIGKEEYEEIYELLKKEFSKDINAPIKYISSEIEKIMNELILPIPLSRIHFTESRLQDFITENKKVQYVICGAGADTFSFRNTNPDVEIYEIDHPDTQKYKLEKIKSLEWNIPKNVHFVSVDFEKEKMQEKLLSAGFDTKMKSFFSILGVSYYLTLPVFSDTLLAVSELSSYESAVAFDYPTKLKETHEFKRVKRLESMTEKLGEKMQVGFTYNELSRALFQYGFQIDTFLNPIKIQELYFKNHKDGLVAYENVNLVSAIYTGGRTFE